MNNRCIEEENQPPHTMPAVSRGTLLPKANCDGTEDNCHQKGEVAKGIASESTGLVIEAKIIGEIESQGTGYIDQVRTNLFKCDGKVCSKVGQELEVVEHRIEPERHGLGDS